MPLGLFAKLVIGSPFVCIFQGGIGLAGFFELRLGIGFFGHIGVELTRQLAVSFFDLIQISITRHPQHSVVVFVFHVTDAFLPKIPVCWLEGKASVWRRTQGGFIP